MSSWAERYRPTTSGDVVGNVDAMCELQEWSLTGIHDCPAVLVHGPPGIGKTSAVHAVAADRNWSLIDVDGSCTRTAAELEAAVENARQGAQFRTGSIGRQLLCIDEADSIQGSGQRGGYRVVSRLIRDGENPVAVVANDKHQIPHAIRDYTREIEFHRPSVTDVAERLVTICELAGEDPPSEQVVERIARAADGDVRRAVLLVEFVVKTGLTDLVSLVDTTDGEVSQRSCESPSIFDALDTLFYTGDSTKAQRVLDATPKSPPQLVAWVRANLTDDQTNQVLPHAYAWLGAAERQCERAVRTRDYTAWRYVTPLLAGVATLDAARPDTWTPYESPAARRQPSEKQDNIPDDSRSGKWVSTMQTQTPGSTCLSLSAGGDRARPPDFRSQSQRESPHPEKTSGQSQLDDWENNN